MVRLQPPQEFRVGRVSLRDAQGRAGEEGVGAVRRIVQQTVQEPGGERRIFPRDLIGP